MNLEDFKRMIGLLKSHSEKLHAAYSLNIDLIDFCDQQASVINILIKEVYGDEGRDTFNWWCYEKKWGTRKDLEMRSADGELLCDSIEDLHSWLENNAKEVC